MKNHGGLEFDEEKVRSALVKTNGSLPALLRILRQIGQDEDDEESQNAEKVNVAEEKEEELLVRVDERKFMESVRLNYSHTQIASLRDSSSSLMEKN